MQPDAALYLEQFAYSEGLTLEYLESGAVILGTEDEIFEALNSLDS